jgi:predicted transcriptional regulator
MKVLLSIKPEFALKIFDGSKGYEFRRNIFRKRGINTVIVYATRPLGKVVGEFEIEDILHEELTTLWDKTKSRAGTSEEKFRKYFSDKYKGYAIQIKSVKRYDKPKTLDSFMVASPPQSFMYI